MSKSQSSNEVASPAAQQRELVKWRKDLEERENDVIMRERLLDDGKADSQHELRMLEAKLAAARSDLDSVMGEIEDMRKARKLAVDERDRLSKQAADEANVVQGMADERREELAAVAAEVKTAKRKLRELDKEQVERKKYLAEQEELIEQTVREGNQSIAALNRQLAEFEAKKEELLRHHNTIEMNIADSTAKLVAIEDKTDTLRERYEVTAVKYRSELAGARAAMIDAQERKTKIDRELDAKMLDLKTKESELAIRTDVLSKRADEIEGEKRKLESKKALYGML